MRFFDLPSTEKEAILYCQEKGLLAKSSKCNKGHEMKLSFERARWRCSCKGCRTEKCLRKGSWIEGSRISFVRVLRFLYAWSHEMTSSSYCSHEIGIEKNAVVIWNTWLREVCVNAVTQRNLQSKRWTFLKGLLLRFSKKYKICIVRGNWKTRQRRWSGRKLIHKAKKPRWSSLSSGLDLWWNLPKNEWNFPCHCSRQNS